MRGEGYDGSLLKSPILFLTFRVIFLISIDRCVPYDIIWLIASSIIINSYLFLYSARSGSVME